MDMTDTDGTINDPEGSAEESEADDDATPNQIKDTPITLGSLGSDRLPKQGKERKAPFLYSSVFFLIALPLLIMFGMNASNNSRLNEKFREVIREDSRNTGIDAQVHYRDFLNKSVLVYDLKSIAGDKAMADVFRVFLQFSEKMKSENFEMVELSCNAKLKFLLPGSYFRQLGEEYSSQNPVYTIRTFPENLLNIDGSKAYEQWTGGVLGVLNRQMEDFNDFNKKWYMEELAR